MIFKKNRLSILPALVVCSCCGREMTVESRMTLIPLPDKPALTKDPSQDVQILGEHALKLRHLINTYNTVAEKHNLENGFPPTVK